MSRLVRLAEFAEAVAGSGPLRLSWFTAGRRQELRAVAEEHGRQTAEVLRIQASLAQDCSAEAFWPQSRHLVERSAEYSSFWQRFWGGYRAYHREVQRLFADRLPSSPALLAKLSQLRAYHRLQAEVQQREQSLEADLLPGPLGRADWEATIQGLDAVERIVRFTASDDGLRKRLCQAEVLDRTRIADLAVRLRALVQELRGAVEQIRVRFAMTRIDAATAYDDLSAGELEHWLREAATHLGQQVQALTEIQDTLVPAADLQLGDLSRHAARCRELTAALEANEQLQLQSAQFGLPEAELLPTPDRLAAAEWVVTHERRYPSGIPALLVKAATCSRTRSLIDMVTRQLADALSPEFEASWRYLEESVFPLDQPVSTGLVIESASLTDLQRWLDQLQLGLPQLREWMRFTTTQAKLAESRLSDLWNDVLAGRISVDQAPAAFTGRFYRLWLDAVYRADACLRQFHLEDHERLIEQFRKLDRRSVEWGFSRIRAKLLSDPHRPHSESLAPASSELGILQRECNKKSRHLPLRLLFQKIPRILQRLKPCVMMSPLAVSTYLNSPELTFDLVIFDEASQVRPFDAVGAIYRGRQLVVAGDQKQLPPTSFFDRSLEETEAESDEESGAVNLRDYESVLDICLSMGLPRKRLRWHYRSRREPLIAFSNYHFYGNELVTFPSVHDADGRSAISHVYVPEGRWKSGSGGGVNAEEARRTAELVFQHFEQCPGKTLGVITFNLRQQLLVLDWLEELRKERLEMEPFFAEDIREPVFVKNLENVQGDERDVIFLSLGYGLDEQGRFQRRFGPLASQGGERRLNVAVTRAREQVKLISSIRSVDLDVTGLQHPGPALLKAYLDYAERGVSALGQERTTPLTAESESPFEEAVYTALVQQGLQVQPQVGCGGYRIDLAVVHPEEPGRYVLGVECDGAAYHSSRTARDRDRLRQAVLETALGWRIVRIWSTDWIRDPRRQLERVCQAYQQALQSVTAPVPPEPEPDPAPKIRIRRRPSPVTDTPTSGGVEELADEQLSERLVSVLEQQGAMDLDDLVRQVARSFGFQRTGSRIRQRIETVLKRSIRTKVLQRDSLGRLISARDPSSGGPDDGSRATVTGPPRRSRRRTEL